MHTDDTELDPHPVNPGFWSFFIRRMVMGLEQNLTHQYLKRWNDTPENQARDKRRTMGSWVAGLSLMVMWLALFGPVLFFVVFLPALVCGAIHVSHFNWITHNAGASGAPDYRPTNQNSGVYWLGNKLFFGMYMHANHHAYLKLFNPMKIPAEQAARVEGKVSRHRVRRGLSA